MRERYEGEEDDRGRWPGDDREHDDPSRSHGGHGGADRRGEGPRTGHGDDEGADWGDVQIGRWGGARHRPPERDGPGRWGRGGSRGGGRGGRRRRGRDTEPSGGRDYRGEEGRDWRYGASDLDREWEPEGGARRGRTAGRFGGVGPKGYQRADDRIREDVCDRLTADAYVDPSDVTV